MLNRIEVTDPPNRAPQYMLESRMMADTGCMPKVRGSRSDTPLGAPRPGNTPTRMPSSTPTTISARCGTVTAIPKPCISASTFSMASEPQDLAQHPVRKGYLECPFENEVEQDGRGHGVDEGLEA